MTLASRSLCFRSFLLLTLLVLAACSNDEMTPTDAGVDSSIVDSSIADSAVNDSSTNDDAAFDAMLNDGSVSDASVDATADASDMGCVYPSRMCGDVCSPCPTTPGILSIDCAANECVAIGCHTGYFLHDGICIAGGWTGGTIATVGDTGGLSYLSDLAIAIDSEARIHATYYDYANANIRHAMLTTLGWVSTVVTESTALRPVLSMVIDADDHPAIAAQRVSDSALVVVRFTGSAWDTQVVDVDGRAASLAVDPSGALHLAYFDNATDDLMYASYVGSAWESEMVADTSDYLDPPSLAFGSDGTPNIAFHDVDASSLRFARGAESVWTTVTIDASADVGHSPSLVMDASNRGHIAYADRSVNALNYAVEGESAWTNTSIGLSGINGGVQSLALASDGTPRFTFERRTDHTLVYVRPAGAGWALETADAAALVGYHSQIVLDAMDYPHIIYSDYTGHGVKYITQRAD